MQINLATEEYDYGSNFTGSAYTAPIAGVYHFDAAFNSTALASGVRSTAAIYKNGSAAFYGITAAPVSTGALNSVSGDLLLAANDVITFWGVQDSAGGETTQTGSTLTWMSGHLVHKA